MDLTSMIDSDLQDDVNEALDQLTRDKEAYDATDACICAGHAMMDALQMVPCALAISILGNALHAKALEKGLIE